MSDETWLLGAPVAGGGLGAWLGGDEAGLRLCVWGVFSGAVLSWTVVSALEAEPGFHRLGRFGAAWLRTFWWIRLVASCAMTLALMLPLPCVGGATTAALAWTGARSLLPLVVGSLASCGFLLIEYRRMRNRANVWPLPIVNVVAMSLVLSTSYLFVIRGESSSSLTGEPRWGWELVQAALWLLFGGAVLAAAGAFAAPRSSGPG